MTKRICSILLGALFPALLLAQGKPGWRTITSIGVISGESNAKPMYQFSAGARFNRLFTGAGISYDEYRFKSVPVYADLRMDLDKKQLFFAYANGGYNFARSRQNDGEQWMQNKYKGGLYLDAGLGVRLPVGLLHRFSISAGYSRKEMTMEQTQTMICLMPPCYEYKYDYKYGFTRVMARISWEFGK